MLVNLFNSLVPPFSYDEVQKQWWRREGMSELKKPQYLIYWITRIRWNVEFVWNKKTLSSSLFLQLVAIMDVDYAPCPWKIATCVVIRFDVINKFQKSMSKTPKMSEDWSLLLIICPPYNHQSVKYQLPQQTISFIWLFRPTTVIICWGTDNKYHDFIEFHKRDTSMIEGRSKNSKKGCNNEEQTLRSQSLQNLLVVRCLRLE